MKRIILSLLTVLLITSNCFASVTCSGGVLDVNAETLKPTTKSTKYGSTQSTFYITTAIRNGGATSTHSCYYSGNSAEQRAITWLVPYGEPYVTPRAYYGLVIGNSQVWVQPSLTETQKEVVTGRYADGYTTYDAAAPGEGAPYYCMNYGYLKGNGGQVRFSGITGSSSCSNCGWSQSGYSIDDYYCTIYTPVTFYKITSYGDTVELVSDNSITSVVFKNCKTDGVNLTPSVPLTINGGQYKGAPAIGGSGCTISKGILIDTAGTSSYILADGSVADISTDNQGNTVISVKLENPPIVIDWGEFPGINLDIDMSAPRNRYINVKGWSEEIFRPPESDFKFWDVQR